MKKELKEMIDLIKEDPKEFFGGLLLLTTMFGTFYVSMWIFY
tara:strand:+ start:55 stop:180 length:126 start_codon:yes stop_codon:yes gene_type:complete